MNHLALMALLLASHSAIAQTPTGIWINEFINRIETCRQDCKYTINGQNMQPTFDFEYEKASKVLSVYVAFINMKSETETDLHYFADLPLDKAKFYLKYQLSNLSPTNLFFQ